MSFINKKIICGIAIFIVVCLIAYSYKWTFDKGDANGYARSEKEHLEQSIEIQRQVAAREKELIDKNTKLAEENNTLRNSRVAAEQALQNKVKEYSLSSTRQAVYLDAEWRKLHDEATILITQ